MIDFAVFSNIGDRSVNEDYVSVYADAGRFCFAVADGLGGEGQGDVASSFVCKSAVDLAEKTEKLDGAFLAKCFEDVNRALLGEKESKGVQTGMTATLTLLTIQDGVANWGHIGDTRIYCFSDMGAEFISTDHSLAQFMIATGMSDETDVRKSPDRSTLMAAMGMETPQQAYEIDMTEYYTEAPMTFLICTDGLWQYIYEDEMANVIAAGGTAEEMMNALVRIWKKGGVDEVKDNASAILVNITDSDA